MLMDYSELNDREKMEIIERHWYIEAQSFVNASDPVAKEEAYNRSDMLLDAFNDIVADLGQFVTRSCDGATSTVL